jgi:acyl-CoA thioester hydrolase
MENKEFLVLLSTSVRREWLDYNRHFNAGYYAVVFNEAIERFLQHVGLGEDLVKAGIGTTFALECHLTYQRELYENDPLRITLQLLDYDEKKFHFFLRMFHADKGFLAATYEQISIFVDYETRKSAPIPASALEKLARLYEAHRTLPKPPEVGSVIGIRRNASTS